MTQELDSMALFTGLIGGLALFLFGMDIMTRALKQIAGASLKNILGRVTNNRFLGLTTGAAITAVIQSSSITTVMLIGFISAGLMTTAQSVAVILGANIGTTITAQILAFKVTALALPVLSLGFFVSFISSNRKVREYGRILLGIGMVFFGMATMSETMSPLRSFQPFLDFMLSLDNVLLAALVGAAFTALVQSSSATTGILIVMAGQGLMGLETAIALALGANVGTGVTAGLAAIGKPREAVRAAVIHIVFNTVGVLIWIGFVDQLVMLARFLTPGGADGSIPRQLANVHTFFNVINAFLVIGFTTQIAKLVEWLIPDRPETVEPRYAPKHLDPNLLAVPAFALEAVRLETTRLGNLVREMLTDAFPIVTTGSPVEIDRLHVMVRPIDLLHREIVGYLRRVSLRMLPAKESAEMLALIKIANDLDHVADLVATGLVTSARRRLKENVVISPATAAVIAGLHTEVLEAMDGVLSALKGQDLDSAVEVRAMKTGFAALVEDIAAHEVDRLRADDPLRLHTYAREIELTETLDDIFKIIRRIARTEMALFRPLRHDGEKRSQG